MIDTFDGLAIRWLGPLIDQGFDGWIGELSEAAWGHLELCGWQDAYADGGPMLDRGGSIRPAWEQAFGRTARLLAGEGAYAGPESDPERWAAWLVFEMAAPHGWVRARAEEAP